MQLRAPFRPERLQPSAKLEALLVPLRPASAEVAPLEGARDQLPRGRTPHGLTLTYTLKLEEGGKITPRLPMLNGCAPAVACRRPTSLQSCRAYSEPPTATCQAAQ